METHTIIQIIQKMGNDCDIELQNVEMSVVFNVFYFGPMIEIKEICCLRTKVFIDPV